MPSLWKLCTSDELTGVFRKSLADQAPEEIIYAFTMALPAMSPTERVMIINQGRAVGPPEAFQAAIKIAEHVLTPTDFSSLKKALNLES